MSRRAKEIADPSEVRIDEGGRVGPGRSLFVLWLLVVMFLLFSGAQLEREVSLSSDEPSTLVLSLSSALASVSEGSGAAGAREEIFGLRDRLYADPPVVAGRSVALAESAVVSAAERSASNLSDEERQREASDQLDSAMAQATDLVADAAGRPRPRRVLLIGASSIQIEFGMSLERELERHQGVTVYRFGRHSTGLARPDYFDWMEKAEQLVRAFEPDLVIAQMAGNDGQPLSDDRGLRVASFRAEQDAWDRIYRERVEAFMQIFSERDIGLVVLGMPVMRGRTHSETMVRLNEITEAASVATGTRYVSTWSLTDDGSGNYREMVEVGGRRYFFRAEDGIHMSVLGADILAQEVVQVLSTDFDFGERREE